LTCTLRSYRAVLALCLCAPLLAQAAEWSLQPRVVYRTGYNDNISLTRAPHDGVWVNTLEPALLFGVAGIFYFQRADEQDHGESPRDAAAVVVRGLETLEGIRLRATWQELGGATREETGKPAGEAGHWYFERTPDGVPLTLEVMRHAQGTKEVLHGMPAVLTRGALFEFWMPGER